MSAAHLDPALREHHRRFRLPDKRASRRLKAALEVLEDCDESVRLALERVCVGRPAVTTAELRAAVRLLVEGPKGEFRRCAR